MIVIIFSTAERGGRRGTLLLPGWHSWTGMVVSTPPLGDRIGTDRATAPAPRWRILRCRRATRAYARCRAAHTATWRIRARTPAPFIAPCLACTSVRIVPRHLPASWRFAAFVRTLPRGRAGPSSITCRSLVLVDTACGTGWAVPPPAARYPVDRLRTPPHTDRVYRLRWHAQYAPLPALLL